jgi:hypothetical protein
MCLCTISLAAASTARLTKSNLGQLNKDQPSSTRRKAKVCICVCDWFENNTCNIQDLGHAQ